MQLSRAVGLVVMGCAAALEVEVSVTSSFVASYAAGDAASFAALEADSLEQRLATLFRVHRLRDDVVSGARSPLGGYSVDVVPKSSEYERRAAEKDDEDADSEEAEVSVGSADVELSERQSRSLPFRLAREVKRHGRPLSRWSSLARDFPAYRGSLAGPMPKGHEAAYEAWGPTSTGLWVAGENVALTNENAHGLVRDALLAVSRHADAVDDLERFGVRVEDLASAAPAPRTLVGIEALDGVDHAEAFVVYDSRLDEDVDFDADDEPVDARFFVDVADKRELAALRDALDVYTDDEIKQTSVPVVLRAYATDARCRRVLALLGREARKPFVAKRKFLDHLWKAPRADGPTLPEATVVDAFRAALSTSFSKAEALYRSSRPDDDDDGDGFARALDDLGLGQIPTPFLVANGKLVAIQTSYKDVDGVKRAVGAAIEWVKAKVGDGRGCPLYHPNLTPLLWQNASEAGPKEALFSKVFPGAKAPKVDGVTLYVDDSPLAKDWEAYLRRADDTLDVIADLAPPELKKKSSKKSKKSKLKKGGDDASPSLPLVVCNDIVTSLTRARRVLEGLRLRERLRGVPPIILGGEARCPPPAQVAAAARVETRVGLGGDPVHAVFESRRYAAGLGEPSRVGAAPLQARATVVGRPGRGQGGKRVMVSHLSLERLL